MTLVAQRLRAMAARLPDGPVSLQTIIQAQGPATIGMLLVLLAVGCFIPIPGVAAALGLGIASLATHIHVGRETVPLPHRVATLTLTRSAARHFLNALATIHAFAGRWTRERVPEFGGSSGNRLVAAIVGVMAGLIILPIPLGNFPAALSLIALGIGLARRDGIAVLVGAALGLLALAINIVVAAGVWHLVGVWLPNWLSA